METKNPVPEVKVHKQLNPFINLLRLIPIMTKMKLSIQKM